MMKIFKSKNIFLYITLSLIAIFSCFYFVYVNKVSYAFEYNSEDYLYDSKIKLIMKCAEIYARNNDIFGKKTDAYITVDDLVKSGYYAADKDGKVTDPRSNIKYLNDLKIRITKKDDKITVKLLEK